MRWDLESVAALSAFGPRFDGICRLVPRSSLHSAFVWLWSRASPGCGAAQSEGRSDAGTGNHRGSARVTDWPVDAHDVGRAGEDVHAGCRMCTHSLRRADQQICASQRAPRRGNRHDRQISAVRVDGVVRPSAAATGQWRVPARGQATARVTVESVSNPGSVRHVDYVEKEGGTWVHVP